MAIASGCFIGVSFVLKKKGLLQANAKDNSKPGEGVGYLKNAWWWTGMILSMRTVERSDLWKHNLISSSDFGRTV